MSATDRGEGFILTRQQANKANGLELIYWLATDSGPVKLTVPNERWLFFCVESQSQDLIDRMIALRVSYSWRSLDLKSFKQQKVCAFYFSQQSAFYSAKEICKQLKILIYEDDIRPVDRYLMERFICGGVRYQGNKDSTNVHCVKGQLTADDYIPKLKLVSLDLECSIHGEAFSIGVATESEQHVWMIGADNTDPIPDYLTLVKTRKELLQQFISWMQQYDPDVLIGWNVIDFDLRLMQRWFDEEGLPFKLGRDEELVEWRQHHSQKHRFFVSIPGRCVLDGIDLMKNATYQFPRFGLQHVSQAVLGEGKAIKDADHRVEEIERMFVEDKADLAKYNLKDCQLVLDIFKKTQLMDFAVTRSQLTGLEIDKMGGSVAAFTNLYLPLMHRQGYVAPNMGDGSSDLVSPGGYVMDSLPGLYKNILVLDFKSLYPSIIRSFNIDPMGLIEGLADTENGIPGYDGAYFSREQHLLPGLIEQLWQRRELAKKESDKPLSQAIKIIMNSFYGVLGSNGCRFFDPRLSGSITKRGHFIMKQTREWIEQEGYQVIYGDTDSTFVWVGDETSTDQALQIGSKLAKSINQQWDSFIAEQFYCASALEIEFETHYQKFLMPTIRGQAQGSKKRYVGVVCNTDGEESLIFKGMENVRTDWTDIAKEFQMALYQRVFNDLPVDDYILETVSSLTAPENQTKLIYRKKLRQKLADYKKNVPPHAKAARLMDDYLRGKGLPERYRLGGEIEYLITTQGPQPAEIQSAPIDFHHYIEKQLKPVADSILPFVNKSFDRIREKQLSLF